MHKSKYWETTFEDSMDLIAKLPVVAATIYNNLYRDGATPCPIDTSKDWSHNFTEMIDYKVCNMLLYNVHCTIQSLTCTFFYIYYVKPRFQYLSFYIFT